MSKATRQLKAAWMSLLPGEGTPLILAGAPCSAWQQAGALHRGGRTCCACCGVAPVQVRIQGAIQSSASTLHPWCSGVVGIQQPPSATPVPSCPWLSCRRAVCQESAPPARRSAACGGAAGRLRWPAGRVGCPQAHPLPLSEAVGTCHWQACGAFGDGCGEVAQAVGCLAAVDFGPQDAAGWRRVRRVSVAAAEEQAGDARQIKAHNHEALWRFGAAMKSRLGVGSRGLLVSSPPCHPASRAHFKKPPSHCHCMTSPARHRVPAAVQVRASQVWAPKAQSIDQQQAAVQEVGPHRTAASAPSESTGLSC